MADPVVLTDGQMQDLVNRYAGLHGLGGAEKNAFAHVFATAVLTYQNSSPFGSDIGAASGWGFGVTVEVFDGIKYYLDNPHPVTDPYQRIDIFHDIYNVEVGVEIGRISALNGIGSGPAHAELARLSAATVQGANPIAIVDTYSDPRIPKQDVSSSMAVYSYLTQPNGPNIASIRSLFPSGTEISQK